ASLLERRGSDLRAPGLQVPYRLCESSLTARTPRGPVRPGMSTGRCRLARLEDVLDADFDIGLSVSLQPAVVLAPAEVLNYVLGGGVGGDLGHDPRTGDHGLTDEGVAPVGDQEHVAELEVGPDLGLAVVEADGVADADPVLA